MAKQPSTTWSIPLHTTGHDDACSSCDHVACRKTVQPSISPGMDTCRGSINHAHAGHTCQTGVTELGGGGMVHNLRVAHSLISAAGTHWRWRRLRMGTTPWCLIAYASLDCDQEFNKQLSKKSLHLYWGTLVRQQKIVWNGWSNFCEEGMSSHQHSGREGLARHFSKLLLGQFYDGSIFLGAKLK